MDRRDSARGDQAPSGTETSGANADYVGEWADWVSSLPAPKKIAPGRPAPPGQGPPLRIGRPEPLERRRGLRRVAPLLLGLLGAGALLAAAYVQFGGSDTDSATAQARPDLVIPAPSGDTAACAPQRVGNRIQGNAAGGDDSGTAAIFAFQHAFYVARSGEQARAVVAPGAAVPSAADIQRGIDSVPAGTTHCLAISPGAFVGQYTVVVTEYRPQTQPITYNPQLVTTATVGGRTLITGISPIT
ncbi:hypothetical protein [Nocardia cyriacigeorgica]|uniref:DUF8176 domain-containing protein n=1 Tax=Nocardia cyriacigeorgica TaxID=135487 RepID=A0A5R8NLC5_9NOCA|nr:hypothetical protein [Nocardia cyriacigeorgica]TLF76489.1 hypothetical protein FEK34_16270 [Nocardia cyriacigeorgica]